MIQNYELVGPGHWFQSTVTGPMPDYSAVYSKTRYDTYNTNDVMSKLRFDMLKNTVGEFDSVCDFGYGNGAFLKYCEDQGKTTYGFDISDYPVPPKTTKIDDVTQIHVDVMTFFDSLEHIPNKDLTPFLKSLDVNYIVVSVPWCHEYLGPEYFQNWKHRRENEHFHHFDLQGLIYLLDNSNFKTIHVGNNEDAVRKPVDIHPNILTIIAKRV